MIAKFYNFFWFLFLLSLPFQLGKHFWFPFSYINGLRIDYLAPTIYLQDILFGLLIAFGGYRLLHRISWRLSTAILFFIILNIVFSFSPLLTFYSFLRFFQFVILIKLVQQEKQKLIFLLKLVLPISATSQLAISLSQTITSHSLGGFLYWLGERSFTIATPDIAKVLLFNQVWLRPYGTFSHPNSLAGFMLVVIVLSLVFLSGKTKWTTLIASFLTVLLSFSQSAWLVLFLVCSYLLFFRFHISPRGILKLLLIFIFLIIFIVFMFPQLTNQLINSLSYTLRLSLLKASWQIFLDYPVFGVGLGNFIVALGQQVEFSRLIHWYQPVHNIFLLWLVETGLIGIGLFLYLSKILLTKTVPQFYLLPNHQFNNYLINLLTIVLLTTGSLDHYWLTLIQNRLILAITIGLLLKNVMIKEPSVGLNR